MNESARLPASISSILDNLSKRPNVQSTLIISRENGSVISATGALSAFQAGDPNGAGSLHPGASTKDISNAERHGTPGLNEQRGDVGLSTSSKAGPTSAEVVAACILDFVSAGSSLSSRVESLHASTSARREIGALRDAEKVDSLVSLSGGDRGSGVEESDIQLLRMRTKTQEVIIFPDAKYLCCVVQTIGSQFQAGGDRAG